MVELSPAAQVVFDAYMEGYGWLDGPTRKDCLGVAAALRAAAEEIVLPKYQYADWEMAHLIMQEFQAMADEIEGVNLTPNDLSHLTDEEFFALCPLGEHAPGPEPLSPVAWHVDSAASVAKDHCKSPIAAALRAAADALTDASSAHTLYAIADELENLV